MAGQGVDQGLRVAVGAGRGQHDAGADAGREDLPLGGVEAHRRLLQHGGRRAQAVRPGQPAHLVDDAAVLDHDALGPAGAARGVDDVRQVAAPRFGGVEAGSVAGVGRGEDRAAGRGEGGEPVAERPGGEQHGGAGVLGHGADPLVGVVRRQRQVGGTGEQHAPDGDRQLGGGLQEDADAVVAADPERAQAAREGAGPLGEPGEGQGAAPVLDGYFVGSDPGLLDEQVGEARNFVRPAFRSIRTARGQDFHDVPRSNGSAFARQSETMSSGRRFWQGTGWTDVRHYGPVARPSRPNPKPSVPFRPVVHP